MQNRFGEGKISGDRDFWVGSLVLDKACVNPGNLRCGCFVGNRDSLLLYQFVSLVKNVESEGLGSLHNPEILPGKRSAHKVLIIRPFQRFCHAAGQCGSAPVPCCPDDIVNLAG